MNPVVEESRRHLADLIEACQRCAWHLEASAARIEWPLSKNGDAALCRTPSETT